MQLTRRIELSGFCRRLECAGIRKRKLPFTLPGETIEMGRGGRATTASVNLSIPIGFLLSSETTHFHENKSCFIELLDKCDPEFSWRIVKDLFSWSDKPFYPRLK
jgi:hypothetical protein